MKRFIPFVLALVFLFAGCAAPADAAPAQAAEESTTYPLALIVNDGAIDDRSFTQAAWEGIQQYGESSGKAYQYYRATESSVQGLLNGIQIAVDNGAEVVVAPGFAFEAAVYQAQDLYPEVKFVLLDGVPQNGDYTDFKTADNTYSITFSEEQAGFLAGYAAVMEGFRSIGFLGGMAFPAVVRYGYGFLQGADYAGQKLGLAQGDLQAKYGYTGNFEPTPENQTKAASWYQSGTEIIFYCGGLILNSVTAAAESIGENAYVIGVDVDQSGESTTVITSAMKMMAKAINEALTMAYDGSFPGGQNVILGLSEEAVGLPNDFSRFKVFTQADYDAIYNQLKSNENGLLDSIQKDSDANGAISVDQIAAMLKILQVTEVK